MNQEYVACLTCGRPAVDQSHIVRRSQGGEETVPQCRSCHNNLDGNRWFIADSERGWWRSPYPGSVTEAPAVAEGRLYVYDAEGTLLADRPLHPEPGRKTWEYLQFAGAALEDAEGAASSVSDDDLTLVHEHFREFEGKAIAATRARIADAFQRMPSGSYDQKVTSIMAHFDIGWGTVQRALATANLIGRMLQEQALPHAVVEEVQGMPYRLLEEIRRDPDPVDAAMHAIAQRKVDPNYSAAQFRKERDLGTEYVRCGARYDPDTGRIEHGNCAIAGRKP